MNIDLSAARRYLKADGDDDDAITGMLASAQSMCEGYCNRKFYDDAAACLSDFASALTDYDAALVTMTAAMAGASGAKQSLIIDRYTQVFGDIKARTNGIVIDDAIKAAILLTLGHLYVNREDNVVSGNNAVQLPVGAQRILQPKLWIGDLAGAPMPWECGS